MRVEKTLAHLCFSQKTGEKDVLGEPKPSNQLLEITTVGSSFQEVFEGFG